MKINHINRTLFLSVLFVSLISANVANAKSNYALSNSLQLKPYALNEQNGELDESFGENGLARISFGSKANHFNKIVHLIDGTLISAGSGLTSDNVVSFTLVKFNSDGTLYEAFGSNGVVQTKIGVSSEINSISILSDGSIIAVGQADFTDNQVHSVIIKYNADGALNSTFGNNGIVVIDPNIVVASTHQIAKDGSIVVAGYSNTKTINNSNTKSFALAKFDSTGSLVTKFGSKGVIKTQIGVSSYITSLHVKKDGLIIAAGASQDADLNNKYTIAKYFSDGTLNKSFGHNGVIQTRIGNNAVIRSITVANDGTILAGGQSIQPVMSESDYVITLAKYNANGTFSNNFGTNGIIFTKISQNDFLDKHIVQDDGSILAVGTSRDKALNTEFVIIKYNANGSLNYDFGQEGFVLGNALGLNLRFKGLASTNDSAFYVAGYTDGETESVVAKFK